jgi:hypothetical protein
MLGDSSCVDVYAAAVGWGGPWLATGGAIVAVGLVAAANRAAKLSAAAVTACVLLLVVFVANLAALVIPSGNFNIIAEARYMWTPASGLGYPDAPTADPFDWATIRGIATGFVFLDMAAFYAGILTLLTLSSVVITGIAALVSGPDNNSVLAFYARLLRGAAEAISLA